MKTLNLVYPEKSNIQYKISYFPDGQQQITINGYEAASVEEWGKELKGPVRIKSRLNNFKDLELIICTTKALRNLEVKEIHLYTPYFLGSRSDRQFEEGSNNYLKDVICPIINSLNFESVIVIDPHSDVLEACLDNFKKVDNSKLVDWAINDIYKTTTNVWESGNNFENCVFIAPDAGAIKKIYKVGDKIGFGDPYGEYIICSKSRDNQGQLSKTLVPLNTKEHSDKDFVIIDDICDGGRTFINIADNIKQNGYTKNKIILIVTHGIFSQGFNELSKYFDTIYCTNSYRDINLSQDINDIIGASPNFVKQLNVL